MLLNSLIVSFILKTIYDGILHLANAQWEKTGSAYLIVLFLSSIFYGYLCARFMQSEYGQNFRDELKIKRTTNENIWQDIIKPDIWIKVWLRDSEQSYYGQIKYAENFRREPIIVLEYWQLLDSDGTVLEDAASDKKYCIVLNLSKFERVEVVTH